eukprot:6202096-Pleurochrysis_carterae.AAC.1
MLPQVAISLYAPSNLTDALPSEGGETAFASLVSAYEALSPQEASTLASLSSVHSWCEFMRFLEMRDPSRRKVTNAECEAKPEVTWPLVRTHPVTLRRSLFFNPKNGLRVVASVDGRSGGSGGGGNVDAGTDGIGVGVGDGGGDDRNGGDGVGNGAGASSSSYTGTCVSAGTDEELGAEKCSVSADGALSSILSTSRSAGSNVTDETDAVLHGIGASAAGASGHDNLILALTERVLATGVYKHAWQAGDFLLWDNRQLLHAATPFDETEAERLLVRAQFPGEPVYLF